MNDFTRGPWSYDPQLGEGVYAPDCDDAGDVICEPPPADCETSLSRWPANARLIAAAPDGLAAAEGAYLTLLRLPFDNEVRATSQGVLAALRDFIADATGRDWGAVQSEFEARAAITKATGGVS